MGEAAKVAGAAAAVQGTLSFGMYVFRRHRDGTSIWGFGKDDWCEAGIETARGGLKGAITGGAIYGLTQVCRMGAPAAAAIASGTIGLATAVASRRAGKLDDDEFADLVFFNAIEATGAAVGAGLGQALIPVPILGAVVGSLAVSMILGQGKKFLSEAENDAIRAREAEIQAYVDRLDSELQAEYVRILVERDYYRDLRRRAFDVTSNVELQLVGSIEFARSIGVPEDHILHTVAEADAYFMGVAPSQVGPSTSEVGVAE